jgi:hypothetical protein
MPFKALFISPRNSTAGQLSLFEATDCKWLSYAIEFEKLAQSLVAERPMQSFLVGPTNELLNREVVAVIPYDKSYSKARLEPCVVLHTSGSTGIPKPIIVRNELICQMDAIHKYAEWEGYEYVFKVMADGSKLDLISSKLKRPLEKSVDPSARKQPDPLTDVGLFYS